ncbi:MAG: hypothetical protein Q7R49_04320 [Candidatus Daviesbacteria bacterium]|nr:hypothetical protein [Candidatus Daviesbacteria bacterium]
MKSTKFNLGLIFLTTLILYIPIIFNPALILNRSNDLQDPFWPVFYYIKKEVMHGVLPFWNNLFLSGTPLLPDPQFSLFYPLNFLFILLPINTAFIVYFIIHSFLAGIGMYFVGLKALNFSKPTCIIMAILYISTPKLSGYLESGHMGLFATFTWFPFILLSLLMIFKKTDLKWSLLLGFSMAGVFYTHTVAFILSLAFSVSLFVALAMPFKNKRYTLQLIFIVAGLILTFGLIAITFLPQNEWLPQTTRFLLLQTRDVYPKWFSIKEFLQILLLPLTIGFQNIQNLDSEKWITTGSTTLFLAFVGFISAKHKYKILLASGFIALTLVALNNASPIYSMLIRIDWYVLMRVSTRVWFIVIISVVILAGFALEKIKSTNLGRKVLPLVVTLAISEQLILSGVYLSKPVSVNLNPAPDSLYSYLKSDSEIFRVYCINRCLSQQKSAQNNLQLVEGYNTLVQKNYHEEAWQLTGAYWNYYTLSIPPAGTFTFEKPQPDPISLGDFNTKYVISQYKLINQNFSLEKKFNEYFVYKNNSFKTRAYFVNHNDSSKFTKAPIIRYSPNEIIVDTSEKTSQQLTLSEVYSPGWNAYLDNKILTNVQEKPNRLRQVDILPDTKFVVFKYESQSFQTGLMITLSTLILVTLFTIKSHFRK